MLHHVVIHESTQSLQNALSMVLKLRLTHSCQPGAFPPLEIYLGGLITSVSQLKILCLIPGVSLSKIGSTKKGDRNLGSCPSTNSIRAGHHNWRVPRGRLHGMDADHHLLPPRHVVRPGGRSQAGASPLFPSPLAPLRGPRMTPSSSSSSLFFS